MSAEPSQALRTEFDALLSRSGLAVSLDRYEGTLRNYAEMRRLALLLRGGLEPEHEPANVFRLLTVARMPASHR